MFAASVKASPKMALNVVGKAKNVWFHEVGIQRMVGGPPPGMLGEGGQ
jgi:hypothetical protein